MKLSENNTHAFVQKTLYRRNIELMFANQDHVVGYILYERRDYESTTDDQILSIPVDAAQELMDELWAVGLRPSEGTGSAGALAATQKHLDFAIQIHHEDMKLVGELLSRTIPIPTILEAVEDKK